LSSFDVALIQRHRGDLSASLQTWQQLSIIVPESPMVPKQQWMKQVAKTLFLSGKLRPALDLSKELCFDSPKFGTVLSGDAPSTQLIY
jgi:hypothetical protein